MNDELLNFVITTISNSHKCQHCIYCFHGEGNRCACINWYHCIAHDFADYNEGEE